MSKTFYEIKTDDNGFEKWVHFNPHKHEYFASTTQQGACLFHKKDAEAFLENMKEFKGWYKKKINVPLSGINHAPRSKEVEIFDQINKV